VSRRPSFDGARALQLAGVAAAIVLALVANVLASRHFRRWDWTADRRWSLSPATLDTLHEVDRADARLEVWAITGPGDPLESSLRPMLAAYVAASSRLDVRWIDPDRDAVQLVDLERRFRLEAGRTEDGRVATDAVVIVANGDRHWFLTPPDLYEQADEVRVKPREERALTQAIRGVLGGERARLCFTAGHGELSLEPTKGEREWLGEVRNLLEKSNYELVTVDTTPPDAHEPFKGCGAVVIAGPRVPFGADETNRLRSWLLEGGSLLAAVGPVEADTPTGMTGAGLDEALAPFGIALDDDLVHDADPAAAIPDTHGEGFLVSARPHSVTAGLLPAPGEPRPPHAAVFFARSLRRVSSPDAAAPSDLLVTGDAAYGRRSIVGAATWTGAPEPEPGDARGPLVVAMASERTGPRAQGAAHGPRVVVAGSRFVLSEDNWRQPRAMHGTAFLVDSALSWLTSRPSVVDVPDRAEVAAGVRISEEGLAEVRRYVVLLMPLAVALMGVAVWAWRRSSENEPHRPARSEPGRERAP
jgi:hypothetical protein